MSVGKVQRLKSGIRQQRKEKKKNSNAHGQLSGARIGELGYFLQQLAASCVFTCGQFCVRQAGRTGHGARVTAPDSESPDAKSGR